MLWLKRCFGHQVDEKPLAPDAVSKDAQPDVSSHYRCKDDHYDLSALTYGTFCRRFIPSISASAIPSFSTPQQPSSHNPDRKLAAACTLSPASDLGPRRARCGLIVDAGGSLPYTALTVRVLWFAAGSVDPVAASSPRSQPSEAQSHQALLSQLVQRDAGLREALQQASRSAYLGTFCAIKYKPAIGTPLEAIWAVAAVEVSSCTLIPKPGGQPVPGLLLVVQRAPIAATTPHHVSPPPSLRLSLSPTSRSPPSLSPRVVQPSPGSTGAAAAAPSSPRAAYATPPGAATAADSDAGRCALTQTQPLEDYTQERAKRLQVTEQGIRPPSRSPPSLSRSQLSWPQQLLASQGGGSSTGAGGGGGGGAAGGAAGGSSTVGGGRTVSWSAIGRSGGSVTGRRNSVTATAARRLAAAARAMAAEVLPVGIFVFTYGRGNSLAEVAYLNSRAREYLCLGPGVPHAHDHTAGGGGLGGLPARALLATILQYEEPQLVRRLHAAAASEQGFVATLKVPPFIDVHALRCGGGEGSGLYPSNTGAIDSIGSENARGAALLPPGILADGGGSADRAARLNSPDMDSEGAEEDGNGDSEGERRSPGFGMSVRDGPLTPLRTISDISEREGEEEEEEEATLGEQRILPTRDEVGSLEDSTRRRTAIARTRSLRAATTTGFRRDSCTAITGGFAAAGRTPSLRMLTNAQRSRLQGSSELHREYLGLDLRMLSRAVLSVHGDVLRSSNAPTAAPSVPTPAAAPSSAGSASRPLHCSAPTQPGLSRSGSSGTTGTQQTASLIRARSARRLDQPSTTTVLLPSQATASRRLDAMDQDLLQRLMVCSTGTSQATTATALKSATRTQAKPIPVPAPPHTSASEDAFAGPSRPRHQPDSALAVNVAAVAASLGALPPWSMAAAGTAGPLRASAVGFSALTPAAPGLGACSGSSGSGGLGRDSIPNSSRLGPPTRGKGKGIRRVATLAFGHMQQLAHEHRGEGVGERPKKRAGTGDLAGGVPRLPLLVDPGSIVHPGNTLLYSMVDESSASGGIVLSSGAGGSGGAPGAAAAAAEAETLLGSGLSAMSLVQVAYLNGVVDCPPSCATREISRAAATPNPPLQSHESTIVVSEAAAGVGAMQDGEGTGVQLDQGELSGVVGGVGGAVLDSPLLGVTTAGDDPRESSIGEGHVRQAVEEAGSSGGVVGEEATGGDSALSGGVNCRGYQAASLPAGGPGRDGDSYVVVMPPEGRQNPAAVIEAEEVRDDVGRSGLPSPPTPVVTTTTTTAATTGPNANGPSSTTNSPPVSNPRPPLPAPNSAPRAEPSAKKPSSPFGPWYAAPSAVAAVDDQPPPVRRLLQTAPCIQQLFRTYCTVDSSGLRSSPLSGVRPQSTIPGGSGPRLSGSQPPALPQPQLQQHPGGRSPSRQHRNLSSSWSVNAPTLGVGSEPTKRASFDQLTGRGGASSPVSLHPGGGAGGGGGISLPLHRLVLLSSSHSVPRSRMSVDVRGLKERLGGGGGGGGGGSASCSRGPGGGSEPWDSGSAGRDAREEGSILRSGSGGAGNTVEDGTSVSMGVSGLGGGGGGAGADSGMLVLPRKASSGVGGGLGSASVNIAGGPAGMGAGLGPPSDASNAHSGAMIIVGGSTADNAAVVSGSGGVGGGSGSGPVTWREPLLRTCASGRCEGEGVARSCSLGLQADGHLSWSAPRAPSSALALPGGSWTPGATLGAVQGPASASIAATSQLLVGPPRGAPPPVAPACIGTRSNRRENSVRARVHALLDAAEQAQLRRGGGNHSVHLHMMRTASSVASSNHQAHRPQSSTLLGTVNIPGAAGLGIAAASTARLVAPMSARRQSALMVATDTMNDASSCGSPKRVSLCDTAPAPYTGSRPAPTSLLHMDSRQDDGASLMHLLSSCDDLPANSGGGGGGTDGGTAMLVRLDMFGGTGGSVGGMGPYMSSLAGSGSAAAGGASNGVGAAASVAGGDSKGGPRSGAEALHVDLESAADQHDRGALATQPSGGSITTSYMLSRLTPLTAAQGGGTVSGTAGGTANLVTRTESSYSESVGYVLSQSRVAGAADGGDSGSHRVQYALMPGAGSVDCMTLEGFSVGVTAMTNTATMAAGMCGSGVSGCGPGTAAVPPPVAWCQIRARTCTTVDGRRELLLMMSDVTQQVQNQDRVAALVEQEHRILEALFPRHVIAYLTAPTDVATVDEDSSCIPMGTAAVGVGGVGGGMARRRGGGALGGGGGGDGARESVVQGHFQMRQLVMEQQLASAKVSRLATEHRMVTILFSDIVGFTAFSRQVTPLTVMHFLNELYQKLDALLDIYKVYKVETIGDCYVVAGGLVRYDSDGLCSVLPEGEVDELHAVRVMEFAKAMLRAARQVMLPTTGEPVELRLGLHSGPAMSGVVGSKMPRFTVFGETVEGAHKMESGGVPGRIHVSGVTRALLQKESWEATDGVQIEGRGRLDTYLWVQEEEEEASHKQRVMAVYL